MSFEIDTLGFHTISLARRELAQVEVWGNVHRSLQDAGARAVYLGAVAEPYGLRVCKPICPPCDSKAKTAVYLTPPFLLS